MAVASALLHLGCSDNISCNLNMLGCIAYCKVQVWVALLASVMTRPWSSRHLERCQLRPAVPVQPVASGRPYSTPPVVLATITLPSLAWAPAAFGPLEQHIHPFASNTHMNSNCLPCTLTDASASGSTASTQE